MRSFLDMKKREEGWIKKVLVKIFIKQIRLEEFVDMHKYKEELKEVELKSLVFIKKTFFSAVVSILLLVYLFSKIDLSETLSYLIKIPVWLIALLFILECIIYSLWIFRWQLIVKKISKVSFFALVPI